MTLDELQKLCDEAHDEVSAICKGKQWRMCIPVHPTDSDALIGGALRQVRKLIAVARAAENLGHYGNCDRANGDKCGHCAIIEALELLSDPK